MSCVTQCQELKLYDYNSNSTVNIEHCVCTGCCYNINTFIYFIYIFFFISTMCLCCSIITKKKSAEERQLMLQQREQLPEYSETV